MNLNKIFKILLVVLCGKQYQLCKKVGTGQMQGDVYTQTPQYLHLVF